MPPAVIAELLRPSIHLPSAERIEGFVVHQEDAARCVAFRISQRRDIDAARAAMGRVGARVACLFGDLLGLDHLDDRRTARIGFGVEDVDARGPQAGNDKVAPLHMRLRRVRTQARRTGVPPEMVQLVADARHLDRADDLGVAP